MSVAATYAEALYEAAAEAGAVDRVTEEVTAFAEAVAASDDLRAAFESPEVDAGAKKALVDALADEVHPLTLDFLRVLIDLRRVDALGDVATALRERVDRAERRLEVEAVTALPLPPDLRERIVARVREQTGAAEVELTESVDPDIVGGLVLRVGGVVVDGSLRQRIEGLRRTLTAATVDAAAEP
jgi:F-type H+-transporting ATPase subunit delta